MPASPLEHRHAIATLDQQGVATVTLREAGPLNLLGTPVIQDLIAVLRALSISHEVRVVILRGTGERAFVAGADIGEMVKLDETSARTFISGLRDLCDTVRHLPVPVMARIPGWCLGGGLELAIACDLRIASSSAQFGMPEVKVGIPSVIHAALLPYFVGGAHSTWLLLTGDLIDAERALAWGLVDELADADQLDATVEQMANGLARLGPAALRQQKRLLRQWEPDGIDKAIAASVAEFGAAFRTGEPQRFMQEFLQRKGVRG